MLVLREADGVALSMSAAGRLSIVNGCVQLVRSHEPFLLVWPNGTTLIAGQALKVQDKRGKQRALGDMVQVQGGFARVISYPANHPTKVAALKCGSSNLFLADGFL